jgi:hypothetical protein
MSEDFVASLTAKMSSFVGEEVEALVVASNGSNVELLHVDNFGTVRSYDDVGFAAIGIGGYHARSSLMQIGYVNTAQLSTALAFTYAAKKRAEVAPGVGRATDMHLVFRDAFIPVWPEVFAHMERVYDSYAVSARQLVAESVTALEEAIYGVNEEQPRSDEQRNESPQEGAPADDRDAASGAEAAKATESQHAEGLEE